MKSYREPYNLNLNNMTERQESPIKDILTSKQLYIYTDGASRGNPGPAAIAFIFVKDGEIIYRYSDYIGEATNNVAEYKSPKQFLPIVSTPNLTQNSTLPLSK